MIFWGCSEDSGPAVKAISRHSFGLDLCLLVWGDSAVRCSSDVADLTATRIADGIHITIVKLPYLYCVVISWE
jgi:hypothetical protein